jgi:hypothetical protein
MTKNKLQQLVGNDDLDGVLQALHQLARRYQSDELRSDALIQSGHLEAYKKASRLGITSFEQLAQQRSLVRQSLLELINALPDRPVKPRTKGWKAGMSEWRFKVALFWVILVGKMLVVAWLMFQTATGGFSPDELGATSSLLLPVFTAYFMVMLHDFLKHSYVDPMAAEQPKRRVRWIVPLVTGITICVYFGLMMYIIDQRGRGSGALENLQPDLKESKKLFEKMTTNLMLLETAIGIYVGLIVERFFHSPDEHPGKTA